MQTEQQQHSKAVQYRGTVKSFNGANGWGFITPEGGGKDVFVHAQNIRSRVNLKPDDKVVYFVGPSKKDPSKPQAVGVRLIDEGK